MMETKRCESFVIDFEMAGSQKETDSFFIAW
jgi:hypothetical protein